MGNDTNKTRGWSERAVKEFVYAAIAGQRALWDLVPTARVGIVAAKFADIVSGLDRETVPSAYIANLWLDMREAARAWGM